MNNCMVDLETLDTKSTAVILSIGAVMFDKSGIGAEFYRTVDAQSAIDAGLSISGSTLLFWMKQSKEARKALFMNNVPLAQALEEFSTWLSENSDPGAVKVWGNGSDFDNAMLQHAYSVCKLPVPWKFWNNRCYRTTCEVLNAASRKQEGTHHNALDDARSPAKHLRESMTLRAVW
jgi:hypothetical protein